MFELMVLRRGWQSALTRDASAECVGADIRADISLLIYIHSYSFAQSRLLLITEALTFICGCRFMALSDAD